MKNKEQFGKLTKPPPYTSLIKDKKERSCDIIKHFQGTSQIISAICHFCACSEKTNKK